MKINNNEVKIEPHGENGKSYSFFACSCKDEDMEFYNSLISNFKDGETGKYTVSTILIHSLAFEEWEIANIDADQWVVLYIRKVDSKDIMRIQCDILEHGLISALLIVEDLNKE